MALYKIDITQPLLKLEYIFKEYNIPLDLALFYKSNNIKEVIFSDEELTEDGLKNKNRLVEYACIDDKNKMVAFFNNQHGYDNLFFEKSWWENPHLYPKYNVNEDNPNDDFFSNLEYIQLPVVLELDFILEKISKYGRNALIKEEFDFLFNLK